MMLEDVSELLNYKDQDLTLDHLVEIQKQSANEETVVHEPLCKERPMVVSKLIEGLTQKDGSKVFEDTNLNEQRAVTTTQGIIQMSSCYGNILQEKRSSSLHISVLDFFKSSAGTRASPPVLTDTGHNDQDDLPTFQEEGLPLKSYVTLFFCKFLVRTNTFIFSRYRSNRLQEFRFSNNVFLCYNISQISSW